MVAMQLAVILFCASFLILTDGQTLNLGSCPTVSVKADFDLSKYVGTWYESSKNRRYWVIMDSGLKCTSETYTMIDNQTVTLASQGLRIISNREININGIGRMESPGKFLFSFEEMMFSPKDVPYWVLDTDYLTYAVVWSCTDRVGMNAQISWILTRDPKPDPSVVRKASEVLNSFGLGRTSMVPTIHNDSCSRKSQHSINKNSNGALNVD